MHEPSRSAARALNERMHSVSALREIAVDARRAATRAIPLVTDASASTHTRSFLDSCVAQRHVRGTVSDMIAMRHFVHVVWSDVARSFTD
jgi:hypothetical protein